MKTFLCNDEDSDEAIAAILENAAQKTEHTNERHNLATADETIKN